jgi:hypothetical protein
MSDLLMVLAPLVLALLAMWFGFVGCEPFKAEDPVPTDPVKVDPAKPVPYKDVLAKTPGFVAHWPLNEASGNTAANLGPSGAAMNGTYNLAGVTLADDKTGALAHKGNVAPLFDGSNGYVDVPHHGLLNPTASLKFTIELWVKPKAGVGGANQVLVSSRQFGGNQRRGYDILFVREQNQPQPIVRARVFAPNVNETEVNVPLSQGDPTAWRHVVCIYDGAGPKLTLSVGVVGLANPIKIEDTTSVGYQPVQPQGSTLRFGAAQTQGSGGQNHFAGWLDEIAFYNTALTDAQITDHFTSAITPQ